MIGVISLEHTRRDEAGIEPTLCLPGEGPTPAIAEIVSGNIAAFTHKAF